MGMYFCVCVCMCKSYHGVCGGRVCVCMLKRMYACRFVGIQTDVYVFDIESVSYVLCQFPVSVVTVLPF